MEDALLDFVDGDAEAAAGVEVGFPFGERNRSPFVARLRADVQNFELANGGIFHLQHVFGGPHSLLSLSLALFRNPHCPSCEIQPCAIELFLYRLHLRVLQQSSSLRRHVGMVGYILRSSPRESGDLRELLQQAPPCLLERFGEGIHGSIAIRWRPPSVVFRRRSHCLFYPVLTLHAKAELVFFAGLDQIHIHFMLGALNRNVPP